MLQKSLRAARITDVRSYHLLADMDLLIFQPVWWVGIQEGASNSVGAPSPVPARDFRRLSCPRPFERDVRWSPHPINGVGRIKFGSRTGISGLSRSG